MSVIARVEKINVSDNTKKLVDESVAIESPVNLFVNDEYVITLLATPQFERELALGWLFCEGVISTLDEVSEVVETEDAIRVTIDHPIEREKLQVVSVSRLLTTACGLSASKFMRIIGEKLSKIVESDYKVKAENLIQMVKTLDLGRLFQATGALHVAALFENEKLIAFAEDVGRHNTVDKVVGIAIQKRVEFPNTVLVSSGRQPADMVLKAARMGIPIVASKAAPIRSGIITAEKNGLTLVCFIRDDRMNVYTYPSRIVMIGK
jgi:FdhD protein